MIPGVNGLLTSDFEITSMPSKNYRMDYAVRIIGVVNTLEAMKQVVYKILNTERYQYIIYSWNYGVQLKDLFGEPVAYVVPELERRITEALIQDERIISVDGFEFDTKRKHEVVCTFTVHTIFGDMQSGKEVSI